MLGFLACVAFLRPRLDDRACPGDLGQALFAPCELLGNRHPIRHIGLIDRFCHGGELGDLLAQMHLDLTGTLIGQGAMAARVGVDFGAIQRHRPQL
jgi:hypothetical protein